MEVIKLQGSVITNSDAGDNGTGGGGFDDPQMLGM